MQPEPRALTSIEVGASPPNGTNGNTNGKKAGSARLPLPRSRPRGPVLWVLLIAVLLAISGITGMAVTTPAGSQAGSKTTKPGSAPEKLGLADRSAAGNFGALGAKSQVPSDVLSAIYVPQTAKVLSKATAGGGLDGFDGTVDFRTPASYNQLNSFFKAELTSDGWSLKSQGPASTAAGEEFLAERAGSDGNYWEIGAIVFLPPSAATYSGEDNSAVAGGPTRFEVELFQVDDAD